MRATIIVNGAEHEVNDHQLSAQYLIWLAFGVVPKVTYGATTPHHRDYRVSYQADGAIHRLGATACAMAPGVSVFLVERITPNASVSGSP